MFKAIKGIFSKDKKEDKKDDKKKEKNEKKDEDQAPEPEDEIDEKNIEDLLKSDIVDNKNSAFYFFLDKEEKEKIITEYIKSDIMSANTQALWESFHQILQKWE